MPITGRDGYYLPWVTVSAGMGMVWENPTRGIPVRYPMGDEQGERYKDCLYIMFQFLI